MQQEQFSISLYNYTSVEKKNFAASLSWQYVNIFIYFITFCFFANLVVLEICSFVRSFFSLQFINFVGRFSSSRFYTAQGGEVVFSRLGGFVRF